MDEFSDSKPTLVDESSEEGETTEIQVASIPMQPAQSLTLVPQPASSLCPRCQGIGLDIGKFMVAKAAKSAPAAVDISSQPQRYKPRKPSRSFAQKSGTNLADFVSVKELEEGKACCPFCRLIHSAINRYSGLPPDSDKTAPGTRCSLQWEIHSRARAAVEAKGDPAFVNSTRRIRVSWNETTGHTQEAFLLFVAPRDVSRPHSDATSRFHPDTQGLGRELGSHEEMQALMKSWLDLCIKEHKNECRHTHGTEHEFHELIRETYFGVIDVADMMLKALPMDRNRKPAPFVALSYVWGLGKANESPYVTNRANILTHIQHGGLEAARKHLPKTLQHAILLVSRLGYRYLWIDSLCIVQDSDSSWELNSKAMHLVYGNAVFTICAADGTDSSAGLRAAKPFLQGHGLVTATPEEGGDVPPMSEDMGNGVRLMVTRPLEMTVNGSVWNERAWTFQERVLSRRCLIFAEGRVYFQCRTLSFSQDIHADPGSKNAFSLDHANSPLRTLRELQQRPLQFYMNYVRMYTGRHLTKARDVLAAFQGITWLLTKYMDGPSLFGMPTSHFDLALLWSPATSILPRRLSASEPRLPGFPTWSWTGWMGGKIEYNSAMLEGCLFNVCEWLTNHTWIQWHIRNEEGHLVPLSDILGRANKPPRTNASEASNPTDESGRWLGYPLSYEDDVPREYSSDENSMDERVRRSMAPPPRQASPPRRPSPPYRAPPQQHQEQAYNQPHYPQPPYPQPPYPQGPYPPPQPPFLNQPPNGGGFPPPSYDPYYRVPPPAPQGGYYAWVPPPPPPLQSRPNVHFTENFRDPAPARSPPPQPDSPSPNPRDELLNHRVVELRRRRELMIRDSSVRERSTNRAYRTRSFSRIRDESVNGSGDSNTASDDDDVQPVADDQDSDSEAEWLRDCYGRHIKKSRIPKRDWKGKLKFNAILPDNPFGVIRLFSPPPGVRMRDDRQEREQSYMPILQFRTWCTELHVVMREDETGRRVKQESSPKPPSSTLPSANEAPETSNLRQCDILDKAGDWCGAIVLEGDWIRERHGHMVPFIAVSDAKGFTMDECPVWTYYIPKERDESEWDAYFVLLLQRNPERGLWERVGLGKVFKAAFRDQSWDEIKLG